MQHMDISHPTTEHYLDGSPCAFLRRIKVNIFGNNLCCFLATAPNMYFTSKTVPTHEFSFFKNILGWPTWKITAVQHVT